MITVVAGLTRSGTSLMMQILDAAGVPLADGTGYPAYEVEWNLHPTAADLAACEDRAVKLLDLHLVGDAGLPPGAYQFIWMRRDPTEQARSMLKFMRAMGVQVPRNPPARLVRSIVTDSERALQWIPRRGQTLHVAFEALIDNPEQTIPRVLAWVGVAPPDRLPDLGRVLRVVRPRPSTCLPTLLELELVTTGGPS